MSKGSNEVNHLQSKVKQLELVIEIEQDVENLILLKEGLRVAEAKMKSLQRRISFIIN